MILKNSLNYLNEFFTFLNSQIRQYYLKQKAKHETDGKYCGICGNPTRREY